MKKVVLHIDSAGEHREVTLKDEISIGRTDSAKIVLPDSGLSRVNTTFFREEDEVFVVDENSTNGTFINGEQVFGSPHEVNDRDEITAGNETVIYVEIFTEKIKAVSDSPKTDKKTPASKDKKPAKTKSQISKSNLPMVPIIAGLSVFLLLFFVLAGILIATLWEDPVSGNPKPATQMNTDLLIPMRVIDPLGGEDPDDLDDLLASWENEDKSVDANDLAAVQTSMQQSSSTDAKASELIVPVETFTKMLNLSKEPRSLPSGERPPGMKIRPELCCGVPKQTKKLAEMLRVRDYHQPLDYAELAEKRMKGELLELPVATNIYVLDVGGNATEAEFTEFSWDTNPRSRPLSPDSPKYQILKKLADNFDGQKYDLNNPSHRKQMKIRLLRMFNPRAKPILEKFASAYQQRFKRPLRITSLTRSMEYQISLNANNPNSFKVSGKGALPPHTSGCAFDLARKPMDVEEQNFMIEELARLENDGVLDALIEYNANACFHIFIYDDGKAPA
jgi:pSer/pThr/pTyr-binding forkhead associated (FHA) protein